MKLNYTVVFTMNVPDKIAEAESFIEDTNFGEFLESIKLFDDVTIDNYETISVEKIDE